MGIVKIIIGGVFVLVGLLVAVFAMLLGVVAYLLQRLFGKPGRRPAFQFQYSFSRGRATPPRSPRSAPPGDVIDIETTDVETIESKPERLK